MKVSDKCRRYYICLGKTIGAASNEKQQTMYETAGFVWIRKKEIAEFVKAERQNTGESLFQWTVGGPDKPVSVQEFCFITWIA